MKLGKFELDKIYCGDSKELTKGIPDNSIDLIVTDPPYQLDSISKRWGKDGKNVMQFDKSPHHRTIRGFMGKEWDVLPPIEVWQESLRILKPGAFAFIMTTPRQDSLCQILMDLSNAGFNTGFTSIYWTYASGFPKASNIGKMVDKRKCKKQLTEKLGRKPTKEEFKKAWEEFREIIEQKIRGNVEEAKKRGTTFTQAKANKNNKAIFGYGIENITLPKTNEAKSLNGSYAGFQPKPAVEVIIVAMKPLSEKTYVDQALKNRKGITWLNNGRIPYESEDSIITKNPHTKSKGSEAYQNICYGKYNPVDKPIDYTKQKGRFPANLLVSDDVLNDGRITGAGITGSGKVRPHKQGVDTCFIKKDTEITGSFGGDSGSFSRYFDLDKWAVSQGVKDTFPFIVCAKASKSEKNKGLENLKDSKVHDFMESGAKWRVDKRSPNGGYEVKGRPTKNIHPTVKPIKLMSYLITLGSRVGDIILDNFCGSGSTLVSAKMLNRRFLGFDTEMEYVIISRARLSAIKQIQEKLL